MAHLTPEEIARAALGPELDSPDTLVRATALTRFMRDDIPELAAHVSELRSAAFVELQDEGMNVSRIARETGVGTRQAAQRIIREWRARITGAEPSGE